MIVPSNRQTRRILFCAAISLALTGWSLSPSAVAQSTAEEASLGSLVEDLEEEAGLVGVRTDSITKRLNGLEFKVFGETQPGSLVERINNVQKKLAADKARGAQETDEPPAPKSEPAAEEPDPIKRQIRELNHSLPPINTKLPLFFRVEPMEPIKEADYLEDILTATQKRVLRFKTMPIPVYVTPYPTRSYTRACVEGFECWEQRTNGMIRFVQVDSPNQARIKVTWKRLGMSTDSDNCALGAHTVTKWQKNQGGKMAVVGVGGIPLPVYIPRLGPKYTVPAQVIEVNVDLIDAKVQDFRFTLLKNIVTHELGHALGLLGHSGEKSDMMYTVTDENSRISQRDINTLSRLYEMKVDIPL